MAQEIIREECELELLEQTIEEVQEGVTKTKNFYISGPFMQANVVNGNRRSYPREVLEREMNTHLATKIKENRALGELGHPPTSEINLDRVSHVIKEMHMDLGLPKKSVNKIKLEFAAEPCFGDTISSPICFETLVH